MSPVTTIVVSDPELLAKLTTANGHIVFQTADGHHVRTVEPITSDILTRTKCLFTNKELDEFSKERTGRSLDAILGDLKQQYGE